MEIIFLLFFILILRLLLVITIIINLIYIQYHIFINQMKIIL